MKYYRLSKAEIAELEALHRSMFDRRQADRVKAVIALAKGWSASQLQKFFFLMRELHGVILCFIKKVAVELCLKLIILEQNRNLMMSR